MTHLKRAVFSVSMLALAAGCGAGAGNNHSNSTANMQAPAINDLAEAMPSGPFAQVEMQMHERMMAATGTSASETWARKMIEHHRGAVQMSQVLIDGGGEPGYVEMARMGAEKQQREIAELERMLAGGVTDWPGGVANPFGPAEQSMHQAMMAAGGANLSETWARKMITHHQGAVEMSEVLIRQGGNPQALAMARRIAADQRREIAHLEGMLRGEAVSAAAAPTNEGFRNASAPGARAPSAAPKATPAQRPAQSNQAAPRPAPTPAPSPTCTPEHREMGHC